MKTRSHDQSNRWNKGVLKTAVATMVLSPVIGVGVPSLQTPHKVDAATTITARIPNPYNNQAAVNAKAQAIIATGKSLIGKASYSTTVYKTTYPYEFSCASYINFIFKKNGINLSTYDESNYAKMGYYVPRSQLQPGDLIFSASTPGGKIDHVAMYIGNSYLIQMADPKELIKITNMNTTPYWVNNYITARRVLPSLMDANPATTGDFISDIAYKLFNTQSTLPKTYLSPIGFVKDVYSKKGINLRPTTLTGLMTLGTSVTSPSQLKKGDLVFFSMNGTSPYNLGIYAGDTRIVYAYNGQIYTRVLSDFTRSNGSNQFFTARRVIK